MKEWEETMKRYGADERSDWTSVKLGEDGGINRDERTVRVMEGGSGNEYTVPVLSPTLLFL